VVDNKFATDRPVMEGGRCTPPSDFPAYLTVHDFKAPCCLCSFALGGKYTKCAVYLADHSTYARSMFVVVPSSNVATSVIRLCFQFDSEADRFLYIQSCWNTCIP